MGETATITATSALRPDELRGGAPDVPVVSVVMQPAQSVISLLMQAASGQSWGAPAGLLAAVRNGLRPQARFAAQSFSERGWAQIPDSCLPISPLVDASIEDHVAMLRDLPAVTLTRELLACGGGVDCAPHWRAAAEQPRRWLNSMADASLDIWAVAESRWRAAGPLLDREIRRIGTAAVRGGTTALLNSLHPGLRYQDGMFSYAPPCNPLAVRPHGPVGPRRLVLVPMIAGRNALLFSFDLDGVCYVGYPIAHRRAGAHDAAEGALARILGPLRAAILRVLRQPLTIGDLATAVHCAPTTATYHLHQLAAADLITREKNGSSVWVSRTARGDELVDLLSD
jgi:DNA-binding transcriptional ArsR family regulator